MLTVKRLLKKLPAFGLALVFTGAVWCASLAAPSLTLASVTGCSQSHGPMKMTGCERPSYLCGFDSSNLLSRGALSTARPNDSLKNVMGVPVGEAAIEPPNVGAPFEMKERTNALPVGSRKVSIGLLNSVLNL